MLGFGFYTYVYSCIRIVHSSSTDPQLNRVGGKPGTPPPPPLLNHYVRILVPGQSSGIFEGQRHRSIEPFEDASGINHDRHVPVGNTK